MLPMYTGRNPFNVKRLILLGLMALVLSTSLVLTTGVASAQTTSSASAAVSCWNFSCDGQNPSSKGCVNDARDIYAATSGDLGGGLRETIILRFSSACAAAWAFVFTSEPLAPSYDNGNAIITRNSDGRQYDCAHGGDGIILADQTSCYSGMVGDAGGFTSWAAAMYTTGGPWQEVAHTASY